MSETQNLSPQNLSPIALHRAMNRIWRNPRGLARLTIVNHTIVGIRFMVTAFAFFLIGGVLAMLIRAQLATADSAFMSAGAYAQVFTMHGTVMMFLFAIPMIEGLALYMLPKILGARDLLFPRLSTFGYFCYLFGGLIILAAMVGGVAPDSGWFMYTPLSSSTYTPGINADIWLIGITFVEISALTIGIELVGTILKVRAGGMALHRMPLFGWYILVTAMMIVIGFPPLILASILLEIERAFDWPFFAHERGGSALLWQHLFWLFGHPEVYIIFLPAAGVVSMLIPTFARRPFIGYTAVVVSLIAMGFISFGLWVHHMYAVGIPNLGLAFFSAASMLVAVPTGVQLFAWIATLWGGRPVLRVPMLYLFGFLVTFVFGGLTGVMVALVPFDLQAHDTHFVVAHMHYVLVGGFVFPMLAGVYYWLPHARGRMPSESLGRWAFWLIFIGFNLTFFVMHFTGLMGMVRRVYTYHPDFGFDLFNIISSVGGFVMSAGFAAFILDIALHLRHGDRSGRNPWRAGTLEWAMPTPPTSYNFASLPETSAREPLWDQPKLAAEMAAGKHYLGIPRNDWQETLAVDAVTGRPDYIIVLPRPHWLPVLCAAALGVFFVAFLFSAYSVAVAGALLSLGLFLGWAWKNGMKVDPEPLPAGRGLFLLPHAAASDAPGWWGMTVTLVADATFLASLLFGYFFLWAVAPGWPPPSFIQQSVMVVGAIALGTIVGFAACGRAVALNRADENAQFWLLVGIASGIVATAAFAAIPFLLIGPPTLHAYNATVAAMALYAGFHCLLAAVMSGFVLARCKAGYVSALRSLDLRVLRLWWGYTAATNVLIVICLFGFPAAIGR